ncbi:MAG: 50S ribosomal protein L11 [Patescibacteria group bacterium]|nr:50S ribosomal protein L11 [Patescibacteria group bacterium]
MSKKASKIVKLQIDAGKANPAPPVGTALGPTGVNMQEFCQQFNDRTKDLMGFKVPVAIYINDDRTFTFETKQPPMSGLIKHELGIQKGSGVPNKDKVGHLTVDQMRSIAERKMQDLNANDIEAAMKQVAGSARAMGITSDAV